MQRVLFLLLVCSTAVAQPVMFRGDAAHSGVYGSSAGRELAGMQWRFPDRR
jgi:hypothetical protein